MGVMKSAFNVATKPFSSIADGIGDRLSIAHISNQVAKKSTGAKGVIAKAVTWGAESVKSTANLATLGLVRNLENGITHKDIKAMDDESKSERTERITEKMVDKIDRQYQQASELYDSNHVKTKAKHESYSK